MKKKILFFIESLGNGGAEKVLSDIVVNLNPNKFDVTVVTVTDEGTYQDRVSSHCKYRSFLKMTDLRKSFLGGLIFRLKIKFIYKAPARMVYRLFIKEAFDIEVAFVEGFATKLISYSANDNSKKIAWVHTDMKSNPYADNMFGSLKSHIDCYEKYNEIVCVSNGVRQAFVDKFGIDDRVSVQYNPVDEKAILEKSREICPVNCTESLLLVTTGRLEHQKGYIRLLNCLAKLKAEGCGGYELWILGNGSQKDEMEQIINDNNLENEVKLLGFQENPYKFINRADAFVCSSYAEGFSTAATEALILGKPIFTTDCAGMKELFGAEKCGEIVENTDEALYQMLKKIISGEYPIESYKAGVNKRKEYFKLENRVKEIEEIFKKLD